MLAIKKYAIDLLIILSSFVCHIVSVAHLYDVSNQPSHQQVLMTANNISNTNQQQSSDLTTTNFYTNSQALKFRVNVSNICERSHMRVTVRLSRPFYGLIHTKDKRKKAACSIEGSGEQAYVMEISYTLVQSDTNYCGVVSHQLVQQNNKTNTGNHLQQTLSVALVVRLHKSIEFSDDRYFLLSCANRCIRHDCSTGPEISSGQSASRLGELRGLVASESIVTPVVGNNNGKLIESPSNSWTTSERCDHLLDLKFQWLAKLCWALVILLIAMFCTSYCLCLALNRNKKNKNKQLRRGSRSHPFNKSCTSTKEILYPTQSSLSHSVESHSAASSGWSSGAGVGVGEEELGKIRDDNTYLGKQQQELILADLLAKNAQTMDRKQQQRDEPQQIMVLGRAAAPFNTSATQRQNEPLEARMKRRRSIGSSVAALQFESHRASQQAPENYGAGKLDTSQRAKSRSQTTIHYEQGQDPFKTVPFSYLNNGYISDGTNSQRVYLGTSSGAIDVYGIAPQTQHLPIAQQQVQIPISNNHMNAQQLSSQFDPQNSRQLIDLIQHKHWQQMAQADRTAATMQEAQRQPPLVPARSWR